MVRNDAGRLFCHEAHHADDPLVRAAERLYLATQHPAERIPWGWIARSLKGRAARRPGVSGSHLLVAGPEERPDAVAGFCYGCHLAGFGGYISYLGVDATLRRRGVGATLMTRMFDALAADAEALDEPLPFVVWESHRPAADAPAEDWELWAARLKLFDRVGGLWLAGLDLHTPNYGDAAGPVVLQLFVKPIDRAAEGFTPEFLRGIAAGLLTGIYRLHPGDPLLTQTTATGVPRLVRPKEIPGERGASAPC